MEKVQFIECVTEHDIDLLILEEMHVSAGFRSWLISQVFGPEVHGNQFIGAWHSVSHVIHGESDLLLLFEDALNTRTAILIENKVDAPPQPTQADRYQQRGRLGVEEGSWKNFRTCMTAPQAYLKVTADAARYDTQLSYESMRDWLRHSAPDDARSAYKARMLQEAIEQNRRGYCAVPHEGVTKFWLDYWQLANVEYPQLRMKKPGPIAAGSDWPEFRNIELGQKRRIVHKLEKGAVDLELQSVGGVAEEIAARNRNVLTDGLEVVQTGKSVSIRIRVPGVDRFADLSSQIEAVRAGLLAATLLLNLAAQIKSAKPMAISEFEEPSS